MDCSQDLDVESGVNEFCDRKNLGRILLGVFYTSCPVSSCCSVTEGEHRRIAAHNRYKYIMSRELIKAGYLTSR
eukprot:scaffold7387_cov100-Skeletonema_dohrnii-CCMP3373.AAC.4